MGKIVYSTDIVPTRQRASCWEAARRERASSWASVSAISVSPCPFAAPSSVVSFADHLIVSQTEHGKTSLWASSQTYTEPMNTSFCCRTIWSAYSVLSSCASRRWQTCETGPWRASRQAWAGAWATRVPSSHLSLSMIPRESPWSRSWLEPR